MLANPPSRPGTPRFKTSRAELRQPRVKGRPPRPCAIAGGNRKGYAGYENDGVLANSWIYHVRHRMYHVSLGRWLRRDPLEYHDGAHLFAYVQSNPCTIRDPSGQAASDVGDCVLGCYSHLPDNDAFVRCIQG